EQLRIVRHVEHRQVLDRPCPFQGATAPVHEDREPVVDAYGDLRVAAGAKHRGTAGVGVDGGKVIRRQAQQSIRIRKLGEVVKKERTAGRLEGSQRSGEYQSAEFEPAVD